MGSCGIIFSFFRLFSVSRVFSNDSTDCIFLAGINFISRKRFLRRQVSLSGERCLCLHGQGDALCFQNDPWASITVLGPSLTNLMRCWRLPWFCDGFFFHPEVANLVFVLISLNRFFLRN